MANGSVAGEGFAAGSVAYLARKRRPDEAKATAARHGPVYPDIVTAEDVTTRAEAPKSSMKTLFTRKRVRSTILFALANFCMFAAFAVIGAVVVFCVPKLTGK